MNNALMDLDNLSFEELQVINDKLIQTQLKRLVERIEKIEDAQIKHERKTDLKLEEQEQKVQEKLNEIEQIAKASLRTKEPKYGWMTLRDFGLQYQTTISNRRMGKLLRVVGLAIKGQSITRPRRNCVGKERFAINEVVDGRSRILWNYKRCSDWIDIWLERNGYYAEFYRLVSLGDEAKLAKFIDILHEKYGV